MEQANASATPAAAPKAGLPSIGTVLSTSWKSGVGNLGVLIPDVAPIAVALIVYTAFLSWLPSLAWLGTILLIAATLYTGVVVGRQTYSITMMGKPNAAMAKKDLMKVVWPYFGISILLGIIVGVGSMFLIIPGIILAMMYFAAPWAVIIDGKGIGDAMSMSTKITKGRRLQLFWVLLVVGIVWGVVFVVLSAILGTLLGAIGGGMESALGAFLASIGQAAVILVAIPVMTSVKAMMYGHLKKLSGM